MQDSEIKLSYKQASKALNEASALNDTNKKKKNELSALLVDAEREVSIRTRVVEADAFGFD